MPCLVLSRLVLSCLVLSCLVKCRLVLSCRVFSNHFLSWFVFYFLESVLVLLTLASLITRFDFVIFWSWSYALVRSSVPLARCDSLDCRRGDRGPEGMFAECLRNAIASGFVCVVLCCLVLSVVLSCLSCSVVVLSMSLFMSS